MQESIALFYREGSSDKVYQIQLAEASSGWLVNTQHGRRGSTLKPGTRTETPVDYAEAKKIYDKLVMTQMKKGYTTGEAGTAYSATILEERFTGILPMLLNAVSEEDLEALLADDDWVMSEKMDGKRGLIRKTDTVIGINRKGLEVALPMPMVDAMAAVTLPTLFDSEMIGDVSHVFDCLEFEGQDLRGKGFLERMSIAEAFLAKLGPDAALKPVYVAKTEAEKRALFARIKAASGEGVVFKRKDSVYTPGRPNSGGNQLKFKFVESATVIVLKANKGKRSVSIAVLDAQGKEINVGNVTIPGCYTIPAAGQLIEVLYLYAYPGGSLFQPVYRGVRDDIAYEACVQTQLKYKAGTESEDDDEA